MFIKQKFTFLLKPFVTRIHTYIMAKTIPIVILSERNILEFLLLVRKCNPSRFIFNQCFKYFQHNRTSGMKIEKQALRYEGCFKSLIIKETKGYFEEHNFIVFHNTPVLLDTLRNHTRDRS